MSAPSVTVKFLPRGYRSGLNNQFLRQFPGNRPEWGRCRFTFDPDARTYDWLVVYEDLPPLGSERHSLGFESLACPRARTILMTTEPSMVKTYGNDFLAQFGLIVTYQEPWAISHPNPIFSHAGEYWFYGLSPTRMLSYDELRNAAPPAKTKTISTVCSNKRQRHTMHCDRYLFTQRLRQAMPELEVFGHGVRYLSDKAEALDAYQYHVTIENQVSPHYWSEKLADAFLGFTLPLYCGCPNVQDYFPPESLIPIDIDDFDGALATIREAIATRQYEKRLPAILEARRRVLDEHNLFALLDRIIRDRDPGAASLEPGAKIYSRHGLRRHRPLSVVRLMIEKMRVQSRFRALRKT